MHIAGDVEEIEGELGQRGCAEGPEELQKTIGGAEAQDGVDPQTLFAVDEAFHGHAFGLPIAEILEARMEGQAVSDARGRVETRVVARQLSVREHDLAVFRIGDAQFHAGGGGEGDGG